MTDTSTAGFAKSPEQLAERWGVSAASVRKMLRAGTLKGFKVGTCGDKAQWRVTVAEVERYERGEGVAVHA